MSINFGRYLPFHYHTIVAGNLVGTKGWALGIIGSILGIVLSVFLIFWFRTDPGDIQYLVVILFLLLPSFLAFYAVLKASFSMLLIADIWTTPLICYLTFLDTVFLNFLY